MWDLDLSQFKYFNGWRWAALALLAAWILASISYRQKSGSPRTAKKWFLIILRAAFLALGFLWALDPYAIEKVKKTESAEIVLLLDDSRSMELPAGTDLEAPSRWQLALEKAEIATRAWLSDSMSVSIRLLSAPEDPVDLESLSKDQKLSMKALPAQEVFTTILEEPRQRKLAAVAIFSDGQWRNSSSVELEKTASQFRKAGIGIWSWIFGEPQSPPDVKFIDGEARQVNPFEPLSRIRGQFTSSGFDGQKTWLVLREGNRILGEKSITLNGGPQEWEFEWKADSLGRHDLQLELTPLDGEWTQENNEWMTSLDLQREKIRVIYMEGTPNETHQLENALESDPDIEVVSMYFPQIGVSEYSKNMPPRSDPQGRTIYNAAHPTQGYPKSLKELLAFDVIVNSDIYKEVFSDEQLKATVDFVENHGGGFVMVGGITAFGAGSYDRTVIDKLMPVDVAGVRDFQYTNFRLKFPPNAMEHPIMKVGTDPEETRWAWEDRFPGFLGLNLVNRPKPGAAPLAWHDSLANEFGPLVVFAVQQIGQGRTMAFTSDTTSGWGSMFMRSWGDFENQTRFYTQFWINAVRWLAADRIERKSQPLNPLQVPFNPMLGDEVTLEFRAADLPPMDRLSVQLEKPDGSKQALELKSASDEPFYSAKWTADQAGEYSWSVKWNRDRDENRYLTRKVKVNEMPGEWRVPEAAPAMMKTLSQWTGAQMLGSNSESKSSLDLLAATMPVSYEYRSQSVWDQWNWMGLWLALITLEWALRKKWGFV